METLSHNNPDDQKPKLNPVTLESSAADSAWFLAIADSLKTIAGSQISNVRDEINPDTGMITVSFDGNSTDIDRFTSVSNLYRRLKNEGAPTVVLRAEMKQALDLQVDRTI